MTFYAEFKKDKCTECGLCFHKCPVMRLPLDEAKDEIKRLLAGQETKKVVRLCESCFTCNYVCPENAHPTELILSKWTETYRKNGMPARGAYFMPTHAPNFRTFVIDRLPEDEKAMLRSWMDESPAEEIFYPGCNWITAPYLAKSSLLDGYTIRGSLAMCCGEMYFRSGLNDELTDLAKRLSAWLDRMGVKKMVIPCTAGYNLFSNILPKFGLEHKMEIEHFMSILLRKLESGEIEIKKPLNLKVTVQDSCHAKAFGEDFMDLPRKILAKLGCTVVEQERSRQNMLCCGIGGGFSLPSSYNPLRLTLSTWRALAEARHTGADAVVSYCAGCMQMFGTGKLTNPLNRLPLYHLTEMVRLAMGEPIISQTEKLKRAAFFLAGISVHQTPALLSGKRFHVEQITLIDARKKY